MTSSHAQAISRRPETLEELRALTVEIGSGDANVSLGGKTLDVLSRLVDMPEQTAVRTISELAVALSVNASTLTRLAQRLGYSGFGDFQDIFRKAITGDENHFYSRQAGKLMSTALETDGDLRVVQQLASESKANIDGFLSQLDSRALRDVAKLLAGARRVRAYGVRQFHAFASFLTYGLSMIRSDVALLDGLRLGEAEALAQLAKGDVLIVASCAPYTRNVADVAVAAARKGLVVVAITDTRASPLVAPADHAFLIPHASSFYSNSMGAYIVFCEGLLNLVAYVLGDKAIETLAEREALIVELGVETGRA